MSSAAIHSPCLAGSALVVAMLIAGGCTSRDVPARYPTSSAASADAAKGAAVDVTASLRANNRPAPQTNPPENHEGHHAHH